MTAKLGCFGSVLFFDQYQELRCKRCPLMAECEKLVSENRVVLQGLIEQISGPKTKTRQKLNTLVEPKSRPAEPVVATRPNNEVAATPVTNTEPPPGISRFELNKKPREMLMRWRAMGIDFTAIKRGVNPFIEASSAFARVGVNWLLRNSDKIVTKQGLIACFVTELNWSAGTANSHAGILLDVLRYEGAILIDCGKIHVRRT
jgi:hypothetical protein